MFFMNNLFKNVVIRQSIKCFWTLNTVEPIVTIKQGKLQGSIDKIYNGTKYYSFKGVPYATPPVGKLRFVAPQPPQPWQGILDATKHGPPCSQYNMITRQPIEGNEDCLFLNIYTKSLQPDSKLPVMVYIHGGAYMSGSADSDMLGPKYFLQHDVVLVTLNYRLEALGFLCLDTPEVPGNAGMKDQVAAMRWVKENIKHFGGDPDNITLFGESAGGSSVLYHMQSPMTVDLFQKVISLSGVSIADWAQGVDSVDRAFRVGKLLGKDTNDPSELLQFFRGLPSIKLTNVSMPTLTKDEMNRGLPIHFAPVPEKKFDKVEPFITEEPLTALIEGKIRKLPLIIGYNSAEGIGVLFTFIKKLDFFNSNPQYFIPREIARKLTEEKLKEFGERIKKFYVGNGNFTSDNLDSFIDVISDKLFTYNNHRFINLYSQANKDVFMYRMDINTELNIIKNMSSFSHVKGMSHADDLFYFFSSSATNKIYEEQERIRDIVFRITKLWVDFAKESNPTPEGSSIIWPRYTAQKEEYLAIEEKFRTDQYPDKARTQFWDKLYHDAGLPNASIKTNNDSKVFINS